MTSLLLIKRWWREGAIVLLLVALAAVVLIDGAKIARCERARDAEVAAHKQTKADYRIAQAQAAAANVAQVRAIEQANAVKTAEIQNDLTTQLGGARAAGAAYAERLRQAREAARSAARAAGLPEQADAPGGADGSGGASLLADDIRICSENTVKAEGWQRWWGEMP